MSLENVSVGDLLAGKNFGRLGIFKVERITKTAVFADGHRFRKDGIQTGAGFHRWHVKPATPADLIEWRINRAQSSLTSYKVTAENLERTEALLKEAA